MRKEAEADEHDLAELADASRPVTPVDIAKEVVTIEPPEPTGDRPFTAPDGIGA